MFQQRRSVKVNKCVFCRHWSANNIILGPFDMSVTRNESLTLSKLSLSLRHIITTIHLTSPHQKPQKSRCYWLHYQCTSINYDIPSNRIHWTEPISYYQPTMGFLRMAGHNPHEGREDGIRLLRIDDDQVIEFTRNI